MAVARINDRSDSTIINSFFFMLSRGARTRTTSPLLQVQKSRSYKTQSKWATGAPVAESRADNEQPPGAKITFTESLKH